MSNIDKVSVKGEFFNIVSPSAFGDYIETIGGACINTSGYAKDQIFLAKTNDVQNLYQATQAISFGANIVVGTNCKRTTLDEVIRSMSGASSASDVSYNNASSHLAADDVQEAIDEVQGNVVSVNSALSNEITTREMFNVDNIFTPTTGSDTVHEVSYVTNADKSITVTVNSTVATDINIPIVNGWTGFDISNYIGKTLYISGGNTQFRLIVVVLDSSEQMIAQIIAPTQGTQIVVPSGANKCRVVLTISSGTTPTTYTYYPRLSEAQTNQELTDEVAIIGTKVQGTKSSVAIPNGGAETTVATMTLNKGKWILIASGYSPMDLITYSNEATTIKIHGIGGYWGIPLSYMFNMVGVVNVGADNTTVTLDVTNWESSAISESTTNFAFEAYRLI